MASLRSRKRASIYGAVKTTHKASLLPFLSVCSDLACSFCCAFLCVHLCRSLQGAYDYMGLIGKGSFGQVRLSPFHFFLASLLLVYAQSGCSIFPRQVVRVRSKDAKPRHFAMKILVLSSFPSILPFCCSFSLYLSLSLSLLLYRT